MVKIYKQTLYSCSCGYETLSKDYASKHSKTRKCLHLEMTKEETNFVREEEYNNKGSDINIVGDNNTTHITNIHLSVPERLFPSVIEALKNPYCEMEIQNARPEKIQSILFQYTRGVSAEDTAVKYDPIKNSVTHKDPDTGKDVTKDLKKYRNEYLLESSDIFHEGLIRSIPDSVQEQMREMTKPMYKTGKKKDDPIDATRVVKICASGDHAMYKMPFETKDFYNKVAKNVDTQIKLTGST